MYMVLYLNNTVFRQKQPFYKMYMKLPIKNSLELTSRFDISTLSYQLLGYSFKLKNIDGLVSVSLFNGKSTIVGYLMPKPTV